jgi:two-component system, LytTR family, response regulator
MKKTDLGNRHISAVIIDDEEHCIESLKKYLEEDNRIEVIKSISDSTKAIEQIIKIKPDVLFLDIEMPEMSGIDILQVLNQTNLKPFVIFITSFDKYTIDAIRASAFDYLLKPVSKAELSLSIERFLNKFYQKEVETNYSSLLTYYLQKKIRFNTSGGFIMIDPMDIIFIQADWNYSEIHLSNNKREVVVINIGSMENLLPEGFARINRSVIINLKYLDKVQRGKRLCLLKKDNESFSFKIPVRRIRELEETL